MQNGINRKNYLFSCFYAKWNQPEKLIRSDIKTYYAYFPAYFIEKDIRLNFLDDKNYEHKTFFHRDDKTKDGNRIIITSNGMTILYSPFVLIAHYLTQFTSYKQSGFSEPYAIALVFSSMFYLILGLIFLRKILLKYFKDWVTALSIIGVFFGTNLLFYSIEEMLLPHAYIFSLSAVFIYFVDSWYDKPRYWKSIIIGLISGIIVLVRPNNITILMLLVLWGIQSLSDFTFRINFGVKKWKHFLIMAIFFIIIWIPQFYYWYTITDKIFYFSYNIIGGVFYFNNPQILNQLISFRSGALMYSPVLIFGYLGLFLPRKNKFSNKIALIIYLLINYYILSSWWSWWNGGSFGIRSFIDSYLAIVFGFAVFMQFVSKQKKYLSYPTLFLFLLLITYGSFRAWQYTKGIIHYDTNTKEMFLAALFSNKPIPGHWNYVSMYRPDYFLGRCGLNAYKNLEYDNSTRQNRLINEIRRIKDDNLKYKQIIEEAKEQNRNVYKYIREIAEENIGKND
jgi:hypothetical protein